MFDSLSSRYEHLIKHLVPGPNSISYFIPFILLPTALCIPPSVLSKWQVASLFLPLIFAFLIHAWSCMGGLDVISVNVIQWSLVLLVCYDPRKTFRRIRRQQDPVTTNKEDIQHVEGELAYVEEPYPVALTKRIPWVLTLLVSLRLANWKIGEASHDHKQPVKPLTRTAFCQHAIFLAIQSFIILDTTSFLVKDDPYFHSPNISITSPWSPSSMESPQISFFIFSALPPRLIRSTIIALQAYALVTQGGSLPTIPVVMLNGLGFWPDKWSPHTWPIFFGPFSAIGEKGLRGIWGTLWHQTNRYLSTPGRALARVIGVGTNSTAGYMLQVVSAFGLSGVMHMGLIPPEPRATELTAMEMRLYVGSFFWMQALGIGAEVAVARSIERLLPRWSESRLGKGGTLLWIVLWFSYTIPIMAVPFRELNYSKYPPIPVSPTGWLSGQGWWAW
ncbi:MAG: hypothetical protein Q9209_000831 [Squamulea sp. 1 TL-2023]